MPVSITPVSGDAILSWLDALARLRIQVFRDWPYLYDGTEEYERSKVRALIRSRKYTEELFLWLRRLRDESYVEYRIDAS